VHRRGAGPPARGAGVTAPASLPVESALEPGEIDLDTTLIGDDLVRSIGKPKVS